MKFINLFKKELSELINKQMIISLIATMAIFMILGSVMTESISDISEETKSVTINISDRDKTEFTGNLMKSLEELNSETTELTIKTFETEGDDYAAILSENDIENIVIIPEGFTAALDKTEQPELIAVSRMKSAATLSNLNVDNSSAIALIEQSISDTIANDTGMSDSQYKLMNNPVIITENTVIDDKSAVISTSSIISKISMQNMILPIIVFVLIMLTSQMLMSAISNEKLDKTLETLLSAPVSRLSVLGAKMLAAAVVALLNAVAYMIGFSKFVSGASDTLSEEAESLANKGLTVDAALEQLGLSLGFTDYLLVGLQLFFTIMICLSISLILGALINDSKNAQNMLMPIMMMAMVPYMISMMTDINALPTVIRLLVYAIPFTHTFSAIPNLMFGNTSLFFIGLGYQIIIFAVCIFFALRLFMSDKIFTISLNFGQKSRYKKKRKNSEEE
ncbi:MAG: ABC transporter permease [Ruminococcus sp.]|nr:ABC transporter permease [Ruminococcus sp.]